MGQRAYLFISAVIFAVVGLAHLSRAFFAIPVRAGGWEFPIGLSWGGGAVAIILCLWAVGLARRR
jgi:hypothetical protein